MQRPNIQTYKQKKMKKKLFLLVAFAFAMIAFSSCRTQRVIEYRTIHDSVFQTRDSVIKVFVLDSVSVREKTSVTTKHDSVTGTDTVFVVREFYKDRWKLRTDTIQKTVYISREKASTIEKKKEDKKHKKWSIEKKAFVMFLCAAIAWTAGFIFVKLRG